MAKKGKLSVKLPVDEINKFNWGAFFGTWIWGLFNKTYLSLLIIPLFFTPAGLFFPIYLGIKGNEFAYKNKKFESVEKFHKSQKKQAIFWSIFAPLFSLVLFVLFVFIMALGITAFNNQAKARGGADFIQTVYIQKLAEYNIIDYKNEDNNYKFYINPEKWRKMSRNDKIDAYQAAVDYALYISLKDKNNETSSGISSKTKIYSTYDNELLLEFDPKISDNDKFLSAIKKAINGYKINETPKLP